MILEANKRSSAFSLIVATAVLVGTVFAISGAFGRSTHTYHSFVTFAGGIESGSGVRYSGGPKSARGPCPHRSPKSRAYRNHLQSPIDLPVKADSRIKIMSMSPLGDNHLEILPGTPKAALAPDGAQLTAEDYVDFNAITAQINDLGPHATEFNRHPERSRYRTEKSPSTASTIFSAFKTAPIFLPPSLTPAACLKKSPCSSRHSPAHQFRK